MALFKESSGVLGVFKNEHGIYFEYRATTDPWAVEFGLPHEIAVNDPFGQGWLFGEVKKTVAKVAVDELPGGGPLIESWKIRRFG